MTRKEKLKLLDEWHCWYLSIESIFEASRQIMGSDPETPVWRTMYGVFDEYTKALALLLGDTGEWLSRYCWENNMGAREMMVQVKNWKKMRKVKSLAKLLEVIEADN